VWREGLLVKLFRNGVQGKMWRWIRDFLTERNTSNVIQGWHSDKTDSTKGLPQGSVVSPLLFNIFVQDILSGINNGKVKFADDGVIWLIGKIVSELVSGMEVNLQSILKWGRLWMVANVDKTEVCLFRKGRL
jgi:retron-type reverse transcriptase